MYNNKWCIFILLVKHINIYEKLKVFNVIYNKKKKKEKVLFIIYNI